MNNIVEIVLLASVGVITVVGVVTLVVSALGLRSARRAAAVGEKWLELVREQHERPELLREERRVLVEELERARREHLDTRPAAERPQEESANNGGSDPQRVSS